MDAGSAGDAGADAGSGPGDGGTVSDGGSADAGSSDAGTADAGIGDAGTADAGTADAGTADAGTADAGTTDGGTDGGTTDGGTITLPSSAGWKFYGPQNGGPQDVYDVSMDEGGNLWVAGGTEGLFLMVNTGTAAAPVLSGTFQKFGIADGLHPYGYVDGDVAKYLGVPDGSPADTNPSLSATPVISVAGGPAGVAFVGYQGKPGCEDAWNWQCASTQCLSYNSSGRCTNLRCTQATSPSTWGDPAVYKSGDADRVALTGSGISVVHYDIFSGPDVVGGEQGGRERLCSVYRMVWDKGQDKIWLGANHGFAEGKASYAGDPTCDGEYPGYLNHTDCTGVWEHSHPAINACATNSDPSGRNCSSPVYLTDSYYGISVDPATDDVWFGGSNRSTVFHYGTYGGNSNGGGLSSFYAAQGDTEAQPPLALVS